MAPFKCTNCNTKKYNNNGYYVHDNNCPNSKKCEYCSNNYENHTEICIKLNKCATLYTNNKLNSICYFCKEQFDQREETLYLLCSNCDRSFWDRVDSKNKQQAQAKAQAQAPQYNNKLQNFPPLTSPFDDKLKEMELTIKKLEIELKKNINNNLENILEQNNN